MKYLNRFLIIAVASFIAACSQTQVTKVDPYQPQPYVKLTHPEWSKDAALYQLNTRQFTPEGTFSAAQQQLPRLKELGVSVIWLMPINPIGEQNRKGSLGSPYSVKDYYGVNPEFGTLADLKAFVAEAHQLGMYVILDWVANHTAWDNPMRSENPNWYALDYKGDFMPTPWWDWSDIIDLNYDEPGLRKYMTDAMIYWVKEADIDGYRCDVAGFVPVDFWNNVRHELDKIKPVFMLAEWEMRDLHAEAFDMTYAWSWQEAVHDIVSGQADLNKLFVYYSWNESAYPKDAMRMTYVSNHDMNAWEDPAVVRYGKGLAPAIVLSVVGEGVPLIYNGQEAGLDTKLAFFERDPIVWRADPIGDLYQSLFKLKKENSALWNGHWGATMIPVTNTEALTVLSFIRQNEHNKVFAVINFSAETKTVGFKQGLFQGTYKDAFTGAELSLQASSEISLGPWEYRVLIGQ